MGWINQLTPMPVVNQRTITPADLTGIGLIQPIYSMITFQRSGPSFRWTAVPKKQANVRRPFFVEAEPKQNGSLATRDYSSVCPRLSTRGHTRLLHAVHSNPCIRPSCMCILHTVKVPVAYSASRCIHCTYILYMKPLAIAICNFW